MNQEERAEHIAFWKQPHQYLWYHILFQILQQRWNLFLSPLRQDFVTTFTIECNENDVTQFLRTRSWKQIVFSLSLRTPWPHLSSSPCCEPRCHTVRKLRPQAEAMCKSSSWQPQMRSHMKSQMTPSCPKGLWGDPNIQHLSHLSWHQLEQR